MSWFLIHVHRTKLKWQFKRVTILAELLSSRTPHLLFYRLDFFSDVMCNKLLLLRFSITRLWTQKFNTQPTKPFKNNCFLLQESGGSNVVNVVIVRKGSALDTRWVSFGMTPSGKNYPASFFLKICNTASPTLLMTTLLRPEIFFLSLIILLGPRKYLSNSLHCNIWSEVSVLRYMWAQSRCL